jgi:hypothetical protein
VENGPRRFGVDNSVQTGPGANTQPLNTKTNVSQGFSSYRTVNTFVLGCNKRGNVSIT